MEVCRCYWARVGKANQEDTYKRKLNLSRASVSSDIGWKSIIKGYR